MPRWRRGGGWLEKLFLNPPRSHQWQNNLPFFSEEKQADAGQTLESETEGQVEDNWLDEDDSETILDYLENVEQWR